MPGSPSPRPLLTWPLGGGGLRGGLHGGRRGSKLTQGLSTDPASSDSKAAGLKCSVGSMALKQQMTLNAQRISGLPQPTSRTTVTRSVKYSSVWGQSRPPVSLSPLCAGCPSAPGGLPQGWAWETDVSIMKEKHKQPLFQRVMCINTPDPKVEIKGKGGFRTIYFCSQTRPLGQTCDTGPHGRRLWPPVGFTPAEGRPKAETWSWSGSPRPYGWAEGGGGWSAASAGSLGQTLLEQGREIAPQLLVLGQE